MINAIAKWSVDNRVAVNMLMFLIIVAGIFSIVQMNTETLPPFKLDIIVVTVTYPSASPEEIEESICVKIEEAIKGIDGIRTISSTAAESVGTVVVELQSDISDTRRVLDDIQTEVDRIETFPEEAKEPMVQEIILREPVIYVAIYGNADEKSLRNLAETVRDDLTDKTVITQADTMGVRQPEISIEVTEATLRRYGLSFSEVANAVRRASLDLPGGLIKTETEEIALRAKGRRYFGREFEDVPVKTLPGGTVLTLGDITNIIDSFEDTVQSVRFDGQPAAVVGVSKTPEQDLLEIAEEVRQYVENKQDAMPSGIQMEYFFDQSEMVKSRISLLLRNGSQGLVLVLITLAIFLSLRLSFWVAMGIPISFMGGFVILNMRGDSINMISLFAFIMVLGMVVDDAIIIGENIYRHYRNGKPPVQACIDGTAQVGWPVIMTILTTVAAFMPLFFVSGIMGKFIAVMPMAIIATLLFSLFEALFILPAHLAHTLEKKDIKEKQNFEKGHPKKRFYQKVEDHLEDVIKKYYAPVLRFVLKKRYIVLAVAVSIFIMSIGIVAGRRVPFLLFPKTDTDWAICKISFPYGTPQEVTREAIERIEEAAKSINSEYAPQMRKINNNSNNKKVVRHIFTMVGMIMAEQGEGGESGAQSGEIILELLPAEDGRPVSGLKIMNQWRDKVGEISGAEKLIFTTPVMGPGGNPIEIDLQGTNYTDLTEAASELKAKIADYPGTFNITDNFRMGKPEWQIKIKPGARSLGITLADIANQVRQAYYGEEALRIQRGRDDIKVMVRYSEPERRNRDSLSNLRIRTPDGREVPFSQVAELEEGRGYATISREDRERTVTVVSDLDETRANAKEIVDDLKQNYIPGLERRHPTVEASFGGQEEQTQESLASLARGFIIVILIIYTLLATQFRSYVQALIVMTAIPFGIIGALVGHLIMGSPLTLISMFGIVALSGIVVNDSLVLIDFINQSVRSGNPIFQAAWESGQDRFRAVLLTTITTAAGLIPILMETSLQAQFLIPMVISITFGLVFATGITLMLVPSLYLILNDIVCLFKGTKCKY